MRALIIQESEACTNKFQLILHGDDIYTDLVRLGVEHGSRVNFERYDLVCYELLYDYGQGLASLQKLRVKHLVPVMVICEENVIDESVRWLGLGADDCVHKSIDGDEFRARVYALTRRSKDHATSSIAIGAITIDLSTRILKVDGTAISLTKMQFRVMEVLALNYPNTISNIDLVHALSRDGHAPSCNTIQQFITGIRKRLRFACNGVEHIKPSFTGGYALVDPLRDVKK